MAVLEKIRSKAVFLTVVIGLALLAFIMGDALTNGRSLFGNGNTIAKVGDTKIDAIEFQKRYEEMNLQLQNQGQKYDPSVVQQQVLEQMISEVLFNDELAALDITVSDDELTEAMTGKMANQGVVQFARQMGMETPAQLYDLLYNPGKYGVTAEQVAEARGQWERMQKDVEQQLKYQKLQTLLAGSIQANKLDRKLLGEENAVTSSILFVKGDYAALKDAEYPVTDDEIKAQYKKDKENFKIEEEVRCIHYIAVDVKPSQTDLDKAAGMIAEVLDSLKAAPGIDNVRNNGELMINEPMYRASDIRDTDEKAFAQSAAVGAVSEPKFLSNTYTIYKLLKKESLVDSVNVSVVSVQGNKAKQDSIMGQLNAGVAFAEVLKAEGVDGQDAQDQMILGVADSVRTKLMNAPAGQYFRLDGSDQAGFLCKVNKKAAAKEVYTIAEITSKVYPSNETVDGLRMKLQDYVMNNSNAADFTANAVKAGYQSQETTVTPNTPQIDGIESTRKAIQWVFDAKKGDVSPIYDKDNNEKMLAVCLDEVYNNYVPVTDTRVLQMEETKARVEKKAAALMAKLEGKKTLAEAAQALSAAVDTTQVTFGQPYIPKVGMGEAALTARVAVAKEGAVSAPVKGVSGVYMFQVIKNDVSQRPTTDEETNRQFAITRGNNVVLQNALSILRKATNVTKSDMIKFF